MLLGSEGELKIVAPNLKVFVAKWASGRGPLELRRQRRERSLWLEDVALGLCEIAESTPDPPIGARVPNLQAFFDAHSERALAQDAADPTLQEMARVLVAYVPQASQPWARTLLRVAIAGDRVEIVGRSRKPIPESEVLIPLIRRVREDRVAAPHLARGLWHSATIQLSATHGISVIADWEEEPTFATGGRVTRMQIEDELARFPRGDRWRPPWMDELT